MKKVGNSIRHKWVNCAVTVCVLCLFLTVQRVSLLSVTVAFPGHTHLFSLVQVCMAQPYFEIDCFHIGADAAAEII